MDSPCLQPAKGGWPGGATICDLQGAVSHFLDTLRVVLVADGSLICVIVLAWFYVHKHRSLWVQWSAYGLLERKTSWGPHTKETPLAGRRADDAIAGGVMGHHNSATLRRQGTDRVCAVERVIAYIDGFNLYFGLKSKGWKRYYWRDLERL